MTTVLRLEEPLGFTAYDILSETSCSWVTNKAYPCILDTVQDFFGFLFVTHHRLHINDGSQLFLEELKKVPLCCSPANDENFSDSPKMITKAIKMIIRTLET